jgi:hypothetical protein
MGLMPSNSALNQAIRVLTNAGAPTNGTGGTYAGIAIKGQLLADLTNGNLYINTNTQLSPTWTLIAGSESAALLTNVPTAAIAQVSSANATDLASAETLVNEIKGKLNTLLTQLGSGAGGAGILT